MLAEPVVGYHRGMSNERDVVDNVISQWARVKPEYDAATREILMRITRISAHLERRTKAALADHDLTFYGFKVLTVLRRSGEPFRLTPSELSRSLYVISGTLTHQLDQLEEAGLVVRKPDPNDRRGVLVELTPLGLSRIDAALDDVNLRQVQMLTPLTDEERTTASDILRKLLVSLEGGA